MEFLWFVQSVPADRTGAAATGGFAATTGAAIGAATGAATGVGAGFAAGVAVVPSTAADA